MKIVELEPRKFRIVLCCLGSETCRRLWYWHLNRDDVVFDHHYGKISENGLAVELFRLQDFFFYKTCQLGIFWIFEFSEHCWRWASCVSVPTAGFFSTESNVEFGFRIRNPRNKSAYAMEESKWHFIVNRRAEAADVRTCQERNDECAEWTRNTVKLTSNRKKLCFPSLDAIELVQASENHNDQ